MDDKDLLPVAEEMDGDSDVNKKNAEPDNYLFIILFYFLGTACFVPHNFYVIANEYWMYKFRDVDLPLNETDNATKTTMQRNFTAYAGIAGNTGMIVFLFLTIFLHKKIAFEKRIVGGMISLLVLFSVTLVFIFVDTDSWQTGFFIIALGVSCLLSSASSVLLVSLFQLAYKFPPRCLAAQLAGQSVCGILAALIQIIALLVAPSVQGSAALFYSIAVLTVALVLIAYIIVLNKSEEFKKKLEKKPTNPEEEAKKRPKFELAVMKRVMKKLALLIIALVLCVGNTGILHAGLTSLVESSSKGKNAWGDTYFLPVCVFLSYNTFEFLGREGSNHIPALKNIYIIFSTSVVRVVLLPLILFCNLQPRNHMPVAFENDTYFIIFIILLAFTSGYILNVAIVAQQEACEPDEKLIGTLLIVLVMIVFVPIFSVISGAFLNVI